MNENIKNQILSNKPTELLFKLAVPGIIGMIVIGLYPFMDGIFAAWIIGDYAMSAISISMPLTLLNSGISVMIGVGSASILSRAIGENDKEKIEKIFGNFCYWVIIFSVIVTIFGILFAEPFLYFLGAEGEIKEFGIRYLRIVFLGSVFVNFAQTGNMTMRGEGALKHSMIIMGQGALLNIILDPIFMKLMGNNAIEGVAIATVISQIWQAILTFFYFFKKSEFVKIHKIRKAKNIYPEMFAVGGSAMLMQILFAIQQIFLFIQAFKYGGNDWGILMSATMRLYAFSFIPLWGMSQGVQPIVGVNYGARQYKRIKDTIKISIFYATVISLISWLPTLIFSEKLLLLFNVRYEIINSYSNYFRMFYSTFILYGIMIITLTFFQSIGDGRKAGIIVILRQLILFIPAILILPKIFGKSAVWWGEPLVDFSIILLGFFMMLASLKRMVNTEIKDINKFT